MAEISSQLASALDVQAAISGVVAKSICNVHQSIKQHKESYEVNKRFRANVVQRGCSKASTELCWAHNRSQHL